MVHILLLCAVILLTNYIVRLYLLKKSLKEVNSELIDIKKDINKNRVLQLPIPNKDLEVLMSTINDTLFAIQRERIQYAKKERDFQLQIEAISHDLRTPLTVILGYLKLIHRKDDPIDFTDEQHEMLRIAIQKAEAMENLIAQFYDYSRLNASDYEMTLNEIDISRTLREVFVGNCLLLENANLKVDTHFLDYPVWIKGNNDALERIFVNLLQNISRYAHSYVKLEIEEKENQALITFENDTDKLCEQDIPNLFERFYMKDSSRSQGGSGLGLTIAKSLAAEMGGCLEADTIINKAAYDDCITVRFTLHLPSIDARNTDMY